MHSKECEDNAFIFHAATGGDAECICGVTFDEPEFDPPRIECCDSAKVTAGEYHRPGCPDAPAA